MNRLLSVITLVKSDISLLYHCLVSSAVNWKIKSLIVGMIVYVFSPADLLSDIVPLLGQVDDVVVIVAVVAYIKRNIPKKLLDEIKGKVIEGK